MKRSFKTLIGFAAIMLGLLMFMGTASHAHGGRSARFANHHAAFESRSEASMDSAENTATSTTDSSAENSSPHRGHRGHRHRGFGLFGVLLRLAVLGLILKFVLGKIRHKRRDHGPIHAEASNDDIVNDIRVGDEIDRDSASVSTDDLTVDDLLHAMKRLGIKKLEL